MGNITAYDAAAIGAVLGQVQIVKRLLPAKLHDSILPVVSLALGVAYSLWIRPGALGDLSSLPGGIALGLAASGTFASSRNYLEPFGRFVKGKFSKKVQEVGKA